MPFHNVLASVNFSSIFTNDSSLHLESKNHTKTIYGPFCVYLSAFIQPNPVIDFIHN